MKVGIVCFTLSFVAGGPRLVFGLARSLEKLGHKVVIYAPDFNAAYYKDTTHDLDIRVVTPDRPIIWSGQPKNFLDWISRKVRQEKDFADISKKVASFMDRDFDVVNIHDFAYRTGYFYKKINPQAKIIWTENAPPFMFLKRSNPLSNIFGSAFQFFKELSSSRYFRAIDRVAVLDFFNKKWSEDRGFKDVFVIRAGVDFDKFYSPAKKISPEKSQNLQVRILALGALNPYRRYDDIVLAVSILRGWGYNASLLVIANNIWQEDKCRDDLVRLVESKNLQPYVDFEFSGVSDEELRQAYRESDVFVQAVYVPPPGNHGWGLVNFEGMAAGLPLVVCETATATEVLRDGENALFVKPRTPQEIAKKIKFLVDHPDKYHAIASAGQEFTRKEMSWDRYARETLALFV